MHSVGPESTTVNAETSSATMEEHRLNPEPQNIQAISISVIPMSPQYGIASVSTTTNDIPSETMTLATDTITETTAKSSEGDSKDLHSTPSRNDRFKVVKIASLEPFRRGRWKCMDYVDQPTGVSMISKGTTQANGNIPVYMQTQSLPQQHFQQMLVQGNYSGPQYYQNIPTQIIPQNQYFYTTQTVPNMQSQTLPQQLGVTPANVQPVYIATTQSYIPQNVVPNSIGGFTVQGFPNIQYVPSNLVQNQTSAFIPTSQTVNSPLTANFPQSQTFAGQPTVSQSSLQSVVNGHTFSSQTESNTSTLSTQVTKSAVMNTQPQSVQTQVPQNMSVQTNQTSQVQAVPIQAVTSSLNFNQSQGANFQVNQVSQQLNQGNSQQQIQLNISQSSNSTSTNQISSTNSSINNVPITSTTVNPTTVSQITTINPMQQNMQLNSVHGVNIQMAPHIIPVLPVNVPTSVYTNPQFVASVNNLPKSENMDSHANNTRDNSSSADIQLEAVNVEEFAKTNPVVQVNAIDNKIEQAMDLVKSHLMYTVREEVEVLKEKITELMERIQQLETENNFLRSQIPKNQSLNSNGTPDPQ